MPLFEFRNTSSGVHAFGTAISPVTNVVNGVRFTLSDLTPGVVANVTFGNADPTYAFVVSATAAKTFELQFSKTATPSHNIFSGTAGSQITLYPNIGSGLWNFFFKTTGGGTAASFSGITSSTTMPVIGQVSSIRFTVSAGGGFKPFFSIAAKALNCFCAGTLIDTPSGKRPVEDLAAGDVVLTADGKETTVHWLGTQFVDTKLRHPKMVNPICITAGALGGGLPERDLFLSQDHAIAIDGTLYNAGALVNGETIYQVAEMPLEGFTYYHVETDAHELLVAEGVAAESYIDYAGRDGFDNAETGTGREIAEMDLPRVSAARMVPEYLKPRKVA